MAEGIEIKEGRYYRARNGSVWGPMVLNKHELAYPATVAGVSAVCTWTKLGRFVGDHQHQLDLVKEVKIAPVGHLGQ